MLQIFDIMSKVHVLFLYILFKKNSSKYTHIVSLIWHRKIKMQQIENVFCLLVLKKKKLTNVFALTSVINFQK